MLNQKPFSVWVTRPKPQADILCQLLQAEGYAALAVPAIAIEPLADTTLLYKQIAELNNYHWAIFISRSAVLTAAAFICTQWAQFPPNLKVAAIGEGTANALKAAQLPVHLYPTAEWSSEGLLALPELQKLKGNKIALFCGQGGRELLADSLRQRGAAVVRFESYRRVLPTFDVQPYLNLLQQEQVNALICTSVESLCNLKKLFNAAWERLKKIPLVLMSERIMIQAKELGFEHCVLAKTANHQGIIQTLNEMRTQAV